VLVLMIVLIFFGGVFGGIRALFDNPPSSPLLLFSLLPENINFNTF
jgi:hypothetical protein